MDANEIWMNGASWQSENDFYEAYLTAVGAPAWHGRNLDAVWDSLTGADTCAKNPPLRLRITGLAGMGPEARILVRRFEDLVQEARHQGCAVELGLEP